MISKFRNEINRVGQIMSRYNSYHSPGEFWNLTLQLERSIQFNNCPWLFEFFIFMFLPKNQIQLAQQNSSYILTLKEKYLFKYYFFVLYSCKLLGKQNLDYFFWFTFCLQYYGCSNSGIHFLSKFGITLSERHYRRNFTTQLASIKNSISVKIPNNHVVVWLDNYSKLLKIQIPTSRMKSIPNFSATAFCFTPTLNVIKPFFGLLSYWFQHLQSDLSVFSEFSYSQSFCKSVEKLTVPLRVDRSTYKSHTQIPDTILSSNCTSNIGLEDCLNYINQKLSDSNFYTLKCDINIYWRIIKFYFIPEKRYLVNQTIPFLGVWHIFKICVIKVFQAFSNTFLVDFCFAINSNTKTVISNPHLPFALTILLYIFPHISVLKSEITRLLSKCNEKYHNHLSNLITLIDNWIPTIIDFGISIASSNFELFILKLPSILVLLLELKCNTYTSAIFVFLSQLNFLFHRHKEYYNHIQEHFDAFIEEKNEILLSFLSRSVISDPLKYDHIHLANNYTFLSVAKEVLSDFLNEDDKEKEFGKERVIFEKNYSTKESELILLEFYRIFREIEEDSWSFYKPQKIYRKTDRKEFHHQHRYYSETQKKMTILALKMDKKFSTFTNQLY